MMGVAASFSHKNLAACKILNEMATFEEEGVSEKVYSKWWLNLMKSGGMHIVLPLKIKEELPGGTPKKKH